MFAWVTGTAGWMFRSVTQYMLGFHPGYDSITIEPCIPTFWEKCTLRRKYRGDIYNICIINKNTGRNKITIDGEKITGNSFKAYFDGNEHNVMVEI